MDAHALRLMKTDGWTYLGGRPEAKKPPEVVVRAFEGDVLFATGGDETAPDTDPVVVPEGEGRRLVGTHFFVRPAPPAERPVLLTHRGLV